MIDRLVITQPDDWHVHLRDGALLEHTVPASAHHFARALVMPNLKPPLTTLSLIMDYRSRIVSAIPKNSLFTPYMTFYLNDSVSAAELESAANTPYVLGAKWYPAGATTHSEAGVRSITTLYPLLDLMQEQDLVLQIHGEVTHGDIFEREDLFIDNILKPLVRNFPKLRIVLEHISSRTSVDFIVNSPPNVGATITPHHLLYNRNQLLAGGLRPHYYCLPILKHAHDQKALQQAAVSGNSKFFAGTDSAPHAMSAKQSPCGCAGIYSAPFAVAAYTQVFDDLGALNRLNHFTSTFGAAFYKLPINKQSLELRKIPQAIPKQLPLGRDQVVPIGAGGSFDWSIHGLI